MGFLSYTINVYGESGLLKLKFGKKSSSPARVRAGAEVLPSFFFWREPPPRFDVNEVHMADHYVYIVSDSIGETAEVVAKAALSQFSDGALETRRFHRVDAAARIGEIVAEAAAEKAVIFYTLVTPDLKSVMWAETAARDVTAVDVLSPCIDAIATGFRLAPGYEVGKLRQLDEDYFHRVSAVEFAVQYDDGKDPRGFRGADLVILGVSRTSKTPVSMYLANRGLRVANLPLVPEVPLPQVVAELPRRKLIGLTIRPGVLNEIRSERLRIMGAAACGTNYADPNRLLEELDYANKVYRRLGCRVLDVTNKAVEETAGNILEIYKEALHE
jgi:regulator of PEP synthase PpsR (kinase-PPPase family)